MGMLKNAQPHMLYDDNWETQSLDTHSTYEPNKHMVNAIR